MKGLILRFMLITLLMLLVVMQGMSDNCPSFWSTCYVKSVVARDVGTADLDEQQRALLNPFIPNHEDYYVYSINFGIKHDESSTGFAVANDVPYSTIIAVWLYDASYCWDGQIFNTMDTKGSEVAMSDYIQEGDFAIRKPGNEFFASHEPVLTASYNLATFNCRTYAEGMYGE